MSRWYIYNKKADYKAIAEKLDISPVTARILVNRGIPEDRMYQFLHPDLKKDLHSPYLMKDMKRAAAMITGFIAQGLKIRVFGDYDADGICSSYILSDGIKRLGGSVSVYLPDRIEDGYGLNTSMIKKAASDGIQAVITCDNGIAAHDAVELALKYGMNVIITDHHEIPYDRADCSSAAPSDTPETASDSFDPGNGIYDMVYDRKHFHIPHADCVVDPHRPDDTYPYPDICGAVVAWKLMQALFSMHYKKTGENLHIMRYLPMAAFATVTDVMPLLDENRTIVKYGLRMMAHSGNTGLDALIRKSGLDGNSIKAWQTGFVLGPCFNAAGRLDSAQKALDLLYEEDPAEAEKKASELVELNTRRKDMTAQGMEKAFKMIADAGHADRIIVMYIPDLHESLCGLVAGKLKEKYHRPAIVLCRTEKGVKGSGRSTENYDMYAKLNEAGSFYRNNRGKDLYLSFGGHTMAAGLTIRESDTDWLRAFLNEHCGLTLHDLDGKVMIDARLPLSQIKPELIAELDTLEPFGCGNEKPVFADKDLKVKSWRMIGKEKQFRKMALVSGCGKETDAVYFGDGNEADREIISAYGKDGLDAAIDGKENNIRAAILYYPEINEFMGRRTVQAKVQALSCS